MVSITRMLPRRSRETVTYWRFFRALAGLEALVPQLRRGDPPRRPVRAQRGRSPPLPPTLHDRPSRTLSCARRAAASAERATSPAPGYGATQAGSPRRASIRDRASQGCQSFRVPRDRLPDRTTACRARQPADPLLDERELEVGRRRPRLELARGGVELAAAEPPARAAAWLAATSSSARSTASSTPSAPRDATRRPSYGRRRAAS